MPINSQNNELLELYKQTNEDIHRNKSLPWKMNIINAILGAFLILIIINIKLNCHLTCFAPFLLALIVSYIAFVVFTCYISGMAFDKMMRCRETLLKLYPKFGKDFNEIIGKNLKRTEIGDVSSFIISIVFPLFLLLLIILLIA